MSEIRDQDDLRGMLPDEIVAVVRRLEAELEAAGREIGRLTVLVADRDCKLSSVRGERDALRAAGREMADAFKRLYERGMSFERTAGGHGTVHVMLRRWQAVLTAHDRWRALVPADGEGEEDVSGR